MSNDEQNVREEAERPTEYTMCCSRCSASVPVLAVANKPKFGEADSYVLTGKGTFMRSDEVDRALTSARRAPEGCVIDDKGVVWQLPKLGCGRPTIPGMTIYVVRDTDEDTRVEMDRLHQEPFEWNGYTLEQCYSTRELAEAAALAAKGSAGEGEKR